MPAREPTQGPPIGMATVPPWQEGTEASVLPLAYQDLLEVAADADRLLRVALEQHLDVLRAAQVQVAGDEGLEERLGLPRRVEHDGPGHLDLPQRQFPPVAGLPVSRGQRQRDARHPPVKERLDVAGPEPVADQLQAVGVITAGEPIGQLGEPDLGPGRRLLGMLMTVEPLRGRPDYAGLVGIAGFGLAEGVPGLPVLSA